VNDKSLFNPHQEVTALKLHDSFEERYDTIETIGNIGRLESIVASMWQKIVSIQPFVSFLILELTLYTVKY